MCGPSTPQGHVGWYQTCSHTACSTCWEAFGVRRLHKHPWENGVVDCGSASRLTRRTTVKYAQEAMTIFVLPKGRCRFSHLEDHQRCFGDFAMTRSPLTRIKGTSWSVPTVLRTAVTGS
jgi:hypothetical protein